MIAELEIEKIYEGLEYAYVPLVVADSDQYAIGIAVKGWRGYNPVPMQFANADSWHEVNEMCKELNADLGLSEYEAMDIIATSLIQVL